MIQVASNAEIASNEWSHYWFPQLQFDRNPVSQLQFIDFKYTINQSFLLCSIQPVD